MMRNSGAASRYRISLQKTSFTGEPIDSETAAFAEATFGRPVCSMYGTTEIGVILVSYPGAEDFVVKPGSLGKPIPGGRIEVHDAEGRPCPPGVTGEMKVWRHDRWIATKDLGRIDADGYFWHGGRADDVIISAGWTMARSRSRTRPEASRRARSCRDRCARQAAGPVVKAFVCRRRQGDGPSSQKSRITCATGSASTSIRAGGVRAGTAQDAGRQGPPQDAAGTRSLPPLPVRLLPPIHDPNPEPPCRPRPKEPSPRSRRTARRVARADRRQDRRDRRAVVLRSDARQHPPLRPRHRRRQSAVVRPGLRGEDQPLAACSRCRASSSRPVASSRATSEACPACTPCGPVPTGPGTSRSAATTPSRPRPT